jgi:transposase, IS30 family
MGKTYEHVSESERRRIERLLESGKSLRMIAQRLGRSISTLSDELKRNRVRGAYDARKAQHKAYVRRWRAKQDCMKVVMDAPLKRYVEERLREEWSPELISGRLEKQQKVLPYASAKAIYKFVYSVHGRTLERFLYSNAVKKKGGPKRHTSIWEDGRISIEQRPKKVLLRKEFGHFEGDFIESGREGVGSMLVLVERKTRYPFLRYCNDRSTKVVNTMIAETLREVRAQSITFDNDISLQKHKELSALVQADVFFCHPQSPHEKGSVENRNRAVRRYIPKKSDISQYQNKLKVIEEKLRTRPMKCLNFQTPKETWDTEMQKQASKNTARSCGGMMKNILLITN